MDSINTTLLFVFVPTFFFVSILPGLSMSLALSMGMSIGLKKTFYMMYGLLFGVCIVSSLSAIGAATVMLKYPIIFIFLKYGGGLYLGYVGIQMWMSRGKMALKSGESQFEVSRQKLAIQGFITAVGNPKAWAFFIALLPPFIDKNLPIVFQLPILVFIIILLEFFCLIIYASGGSTLRKILQNSSSIKIVNKIAGLFMVAVGVWLASS